MRRWTRRFVSLLRSIPVVRGLLADFESLFAPERILENPYIAAKTLGAPKNFHALPLTSRVPAPVDLPVPPRELWEGYGESAEEYLALGRRHTETMLDLVRAAGGTPDRFDRILDFGCAAGRMLRFCPRVPELWGVDLKDDTIAWCRRHLGSPFRFATTTTFPHLPFEDRTFDLVYAGSVFTHIDTLVDAWFLELRRILRPGGFLYVTVADRNSIRILFDRYDRPGDLAWFQALRSFVDAIRRKDAETGILSREFGAFSFHEGSWGGYPVPRVFYDLEDLAARWSRYLPLRSTTPEAYLFQTALLFQK